MLIKGRWKLGTVLHVKTDKVLDVAEYCTVSWLRQTPDAVSSSSKVHVQKFSALLTQYVTRLQFHSSLPTTQLQLQSRPHKFAYNVRRVPINARCFQVQKGRAMAQAVSRRPPTAEARVRSQVNPCGICGGQSGTGPTPPQYFGFPLSISFH